MVCNILDYFIYNIRYYLIIVKQMNLAYKYLDKFNTIEENIKDENWSKASHELKTVKEKLRR